MRTLFVLVLTLALGFAIAWGIAALLGLFLPKWIATSIFVLIAGWWAWTGWKYAVVRDRLKRDRGNSF